MEIETLLHKEIQSNLKLMDAMGKDSEEYKQLAETTAKLIDRAIDMEKIHADSDEKDKNRASETALKKAELDGERKDRIARNGISIVGILLPIAVTIWGTKKSFEFEKEGTITTIMGRGFLQKLLPKK